MSPLRTASRRIRLHLGHLILFAWLSSGLATGAISSPPARRTEAPGNLIAASRAVASSRSKTPAKTVRPTRSPRPKPPAKPRVSPRPARIKAQEQGTFLDGIGDTVGTIDKVSEAGELTARTAAVVDAIGRSTKLDDEMIDKLIEKIGERGRFGQMLGGLSRKIDIARIAIKVYSAYGAKGFAEAFNVALREAVIKAGEYGGQAAGAALGTKGGAIAGTFVATPGVGTIAGGVAGGFLGGELGSYLGGKGAEYLYDKYAADAVRQWAQETFGGAKPPPPSRGGKGARQKIPGAEKYEDYLRRVMGGSKGASGGAK
jgi:hypothetical protein